MLRPVLHPGPAAFAAHRPVADGTPAKLAQRKPNIPAAGVHLVPALQVGHELCHGPRAVALRGRKPAHQRLYLVGQGDTATKPVIDPRAGAGIPLALPMQLRRAAV